MKTKNNTLLHGLFMAAVGFCLSLLLTIPFSADVYADDYFPYSVSNVHFDVNSQSAYVVWDLPSNVPENATYELRYLSGNGWHTFMKEMHANSDGCEILEPNWKQPVEGFQVLTLIDGAVVGSSENTNMRIVATELTASDTFTGTIEKNEADSTRAVVTLNGLKPGTRYWASFRDSNNEIHRGDSMIIPMSNGTYYSYTAVSEAKDYNDRYAHLWKFEDIKCEDEVLSYNCYKLNPVKLSYDGADDTAEPVEEDSAFVDVPSSHAFYDAVTWAAENKITSGVDAKHFKPDASCTRGQIVTFLWRAAGSPEPTSTVNPFTDLSEDSAFYKAVMWAVENKITGGVTPTTFKPDAPCTRAQAVTFIYRSENTPTVSPGSAFRDVNSTMFCYNAVLWAVTNKITSGTAPGTFTPDAYCTRGQIVTFLYRHYTN